MSQRKPPGITWESFVEHQIREAQEAGAFDHLPGFGRPIPELDEPDDELWWIKNFLKRENLSLLPSSLEILRVVERALGEIWSLPSEPEVRQAVASLNQKIARANFAIVDGPASTIGPLDADDLAAEWQRRRVAPQARQETDSS